MVIVMQKDASAENLRNVVAHVEELGARAHISQGEERTIVGIIGDKRNIQKEQLLALEGVENVLSGYFSYRR